MQNPEHNKAFEQEIFDPVMPTPSKKSKKEQEELFANNENKAFHIIKIILISIFGLYIIIMSAVVLFHLLAPLDCRWLSSDEVSSLEKMFVTGIGAALLGKFGNKITDFKE